MSWLNNRIAPKDKSFTLLYVNRFLMFLGLCGSMWGVYILSQNEELVALIKETIGELKTGI